MDLNDGAEGEEDWLLWDGLVEMGINDNVQREAMSRAAQRIAFKMRGDGLKIREKSTKRTALFTSR